MANHKADDRSVKKNHQAIEGVSLLGPDAPADEESGERGGECDGQDCGKSHRISLGESQRPEEPAFGRLEREDRQEGNRDDQQGEKDAGGDFLHALDEEAFALGRGGRGIGGLEFLVNVLDDHD